MASRRALPLLSLSLIGRPNVGKSTLFNRLSGRRRAIAHSRAGLTRDMRDAEGTLGGMRFTVWDTPGVVAEVSEKVTARKQQQKKITPSRDNAFDSYDYNDDTRKGGLYPYDSSIVDDTGKLRSEYETAAIHPPTMIQSDNVFAAEAGGTSATLYGMTLATQRAVNASNCAAFVVDARVGVTEDDLVIARWLRQEAADRPIFLIANKCESLLEGSSVTRPAEEKQRILDEMASLGFGEPIAISAEHGIGMQDLYLALKPMDMALRLKLGLDPMEEDVFSRKKKKPGQVDSGGSGADAAAAGQAPGVDPSRIISEDQLKAEEDTVDGNNAGDNDIDDPTSDQQRAPRAPRIAIVGRPNAGKSTLLNQLLGAERVVVGPEPGVTRDAVQVKFDYQGRDIVVVDTAGIDKMRVSTSRTDRDAVIRESRRDTLRAVVTSDVAVVVIDFQRMSRGDDLQQIHRVLEEGRGIVLAINKWDVVDEPAERRSLMSQVSAQISHTLSQFGNVECVHISAATGRGVDDVIPAVLRVHDRLHARFQTRKLNRWLEAVTKVQEPPRVAGTKLKIRFITQGSTRPPTFVLFLNSRRDKLPGSYVQFLINSLRREYDLHSVPIRIVQRNAPEKGKKTGKRSTKKK